MPLPAMFPLLVAATTSATASLAGAPPAGRYDAELCVTVSTQPPNCGPVVAQVAPEGDITVSVHDFRYLLAFEQGLMVGITMHGSMQVAELLSTYRWAGDTLLYADKPRGLQYELRLKLGPPAAAATTPASR